MMGRCQRRHRHRVRLLQLLLVGEALHEIGAESLGRLKARGEVDGRLNKYGAKNFHGYRALLSIALSDNSGPVARSSDKPCLS